MPGDAEEHELALHELAAHEEIDARGVAHTAAALRTPYALRGTRDDRRRRYEARVGRGALGELHGGIVDHDCGCLPSDDLALQLGLEGAAERPESGGGTAGVPGGTWWPASVRAATVLREGRRGWCAGSGGRAKAPLSVTTTRLLATSSSDALTTMRTVHVWCRLPPSLRPSRQTLMPPHTRWQLGAALPCAARPEHAISQVKQLRRGLVFRCERGSVY